MIKDLEKLKVDIILNAERAPDRNISPSRLALTLEDIIKNAIQMRFPDFEVEIRSVKANWPDSDKNFPKFDMGNKNEK